MRETRAVRVVPAWWSVLGRPAGRPYLVGGLVAGLLVGAALTVVSALAAGWGSPRAPQVVAVTIPAGTAAEIAAGERSSPIPATLHLVAGDTLRIHNEDVVTHRVGAYVIAPGATVAIPVAGGDGGTFLCSFHPNRSLALEVTAPPDPRLLALAALGLGLPLGGALGILGVLFSAWDDDAGGSDRGRVRRGGGPAEIDRSVEVHRSLVGGCRPTGGR